jgi:hypothetical protein
VGQEIPSIMTDFCLVNAEAPVGAATLDPNRIITRTDTPGSCRHGPNLPTHTFGMHTTLELPYGLSFNARGEYMGGHYMYDGAAYNAVVRSVRWPGCYEFYRLQEAGQVAQARAIDYARCTVAVTDESYFVYPADFFKLRDVSLGFQVPQRYLRGGARSARIVLSGHNIWRWLNDDFPVFDPETNNNGGFDSRVRSILEHVPPPAVYTASLRLTF